MQVFFSRNSTLTIQQIRNLITDNPKYLINWETVEVLDVYIKARFLEIGFLQQRAGKREGVALAISHNISMN